LKGEAARHWSVLLLNVKAGVLCDVDTPAMIVTCETWGRYRKASEAADANPLDKNARCAVLGYLTALQSLWAKLGLTPADRSRLRVTNAPPVNDDEFEEYLGKQKFFRKPG